MVITSFSFLCFYAVILGLYYIIPKKMQWMFLLLCSVFYFCTAGELWLILYPLLAIITVYIGALYVDRVKEQNKKKLALSLVVIFCLIMLAVLKYSNLGIYTHNALLTNFHIGGSYWKEFHFLVPLGISFYTLSLLGYLFDVYYGICKPQKNLAKVALFGSYFPVIISGPIMRYRDMEEQLYTGYKFDYKQITFGMQRILWGFFKKLVIAERMAVIVNTVYGDEEAIYTGMYILIATICFAFQLYADFSGGMDIVLGISQTFGIKVAENFQTPFYARTITEFWRRWHITLGAWLKDYLFYPLLRTDFFMKLQKKLKTKYGKKISKQVVTFSAMFILWFTVGLWHGGSWKFIIGSGLLHWSYIVFGELLEPLWCRMRTFFKIQKESFGFTLFQRIRTFLLVCAGFVFFRASSVRSACIMYKNMFAEWNPQILWDGSLFTLGLDAIEFVIAIVALFVLLIISHLQQTGSVRERLAGKNIVVRWIVLYILLFSVVFMGYYGPGYSAAEFIYQGF